MCGIQPKPVDTRPLQDRVAQATKQCNQDQLQGLRDQVNGVSKNLDTLCGLVAGAALFQAFRGAFDAARAPQAAGAGCCQPPVSPEQGCAPAGKGLTTAPQGFPANAVRTAGGYTIVPEGKDAAFKIYGPQQGPEDKPLSRVWGDPHVEEADGTKWDFSKSSQFRLPDGTSIDVKTTAETGHSLCATLDITNGNDHVTMNGINTGSPSLSPLSSDGFKYRAASEAANPNRDTFTLGGTNRSADGEDRVQWAKSNGGKFEGVVKAGNFVNGSYEQVLDTNKQFVIDSSLRPDPIRQREAWGNLFRGELAQAAGDMPESVRDYVTNALAQSDSSQRKRGVAQVDAPTPDQGSDQGATSSGASADAGQQGGTDLFSAIGGALAGIFSGNPFAGIEAAGNLFSALNKQLDLGSAFSQTLSLNRSLFV